MNAEPATLSSLSADYLDWRRSLNMSPTTVRNCFYNLKSFLAWLDERYQVRAPDRLTTRQLEAWQRHLAERTSNRRLPMKPRSINKRIEDLRGFLKYLVMLDHLRPALLDALHTVKTPKTLPSSVLVHAQVRKLLSRVPTGTAEGYRDRAMLEVLYSSGVRVGELLGLDVGDVDFKNRTMRVHGKGGKDRVVPIGRTALRYLQSYVTAVRPFILRDRAEKAVFLGKSGERLPYHIFRQLVHAHADRAGIDINVTPHTFRRSCTTELIRGGANMYHVKELLGHESLDTLKHYARLTIIDLQKTHAKCHPRERNADQR